MTELLGLSEDANKDGLSTKAETADLMRSAKIATQSSAHAKSQENDVSEEEIAALLKQLCEEKGVEDPTTSGKIRDQPDVSGQDKAGALAEPDDSAEVAAILSQLTDAARLEQQFEDNNAKDVSTISHPSLPSVPTTTSEEDDFTLRLANLKSFKPETKNYTGTDRGSINVFVPGLVSTQDDESEHWCGITFPRNS